MAAPSEVTDASAAAVVIRVRPDDTLAYSLPVWLICRAAKLAVCMQEEGTAQTGRPSPSRHLQPSCVVGGIEVSQLMAVVELAHDLWPQAGIWPSESAARARARDACAGIVALCSGASPFVLSLSSLSICADPELAQRVRSAMTPLGAVTPLARCSVTAMAVLAKLLAVRGLLDRPATERVQMVLTSNEVRDWMAQPALRRRMRQDPWLQGPFHADMPRVSLE
jgi:hypothetical protein